MTKIKVQGFIALLIIGAIVFLVYTSPSWYGKLNEEIKANREIQIQKEKEDELKKIAEQKKKDSIDAKNYEKQLLQERIYLDSLKQVYSEIHSFIDNVLGVNGNIETKSFLILRKYNPKDSCNMLILYTKNKSEPRWKTYNNGSKYLEEDCYEETKWFKNNKRILPCDLEDLIIFKENASENYPDFVRRVEEFKSEYLTK